MNNVDELFEENGETNNNIIVRQGFGLTENVATGTVAKKGAYKFGSIGIPVPYLTIGIFEAGTDKELPYNTKGELCISGPMVMQGYLGRPDETEKVIKIHSDGKRWIHTQDIAYMDEDGHLFHIDRIKNIFMRTGFNVHPAKISEVINELPYISTSVVIGFDHPKEQCVPIAFVVLKDTCKESEDQAIKDAIIDYCYSNLEETSIPYDVVITNTLPINAGGKVDIIRIKKESNIDLLSRDEKVRSRLLFC